MGRSFNIVSGLEDFFRQFSADVMNKIMVVCDEVYFKGLNSTKQQALKHTTTAPFLRSERKFQEAEWVPNFTHIVTITNAEQPCPLEQCKGRRYFPLLATMGHLLKGEELFNSSVLKSYTASLVGCLERTKSIQLFAALLYAWPTSRIDKFNCGHGVDNSHCTILTSASKRYTMNNSSTSRWWSTIVSDKSSSEDSLNLYLLLTQNSISASKNPTMLKGCEPDKNFTCTMSQWDFHTSVNMGAMKFVSMEVRSKFLKDIDDAYQAKPKLTAGEVRTIISNYPELQPYLLPNIVGKEDESEIDDKIDIMIGADAPVDQRNYMRALINQTSESVLTGMMIKKSDLFNHYSEWFKSEHNPIKDHEDYAHNADYLMCNLANYVPWINKVQSPYAYLGNVESCVKAMKMFLDTSNKIPVSTRTWFQILENDVFFGDEENEDVQLFCTRFAGDSSFDLETQSLYLLLAGKAVEDLESDDVLIPVKMKLRPIQLRSLIEHGEFYLLDTLFSEDIEIITDVKHWMWDRIGSFYKGSLYTLGGVLHNLDNIPIKDLKIEDCTNVFTHFTFMLTLEQSNPEWTSLWESGGITKIRLEHTANTAYKIDVKLAF